MDPVGASDVRIRRMRGDDVARVVEIEAQTFSSPWKEDTFASLLDRPTVELLVMESTDSIVVGYAVLWCVVDQGELANVAVDPAWRGRGLGRRLIEHVLDVARARGVETMFLEVRASNDRAAEIYRGLGFSRVGVRTNYYTDPREDAHIMRASLT